MVYKFRKGLMTGRVDGYSIDGDPAVREQWEKGEMVSREMLGEMTEDDFFQGQRRSRYKPHFTPR